MNKNGKKLLSSLLVAGMVTGLVGCGSTSTGSTAATSAAAAASSAAPAAATSAAAAATSAAAAATSAAASGSGDVISIYRCTFNIANPDGNEVSAVESAINDYLKTNGANYTVKLTDIASGEYPDKANLALGNNEINLLWTASWESSIDCDDLIKSNAVYDLSTLLKGSKLYDTMPAGIWSASQYNGKDYFVSCYKESAEGYDAMFRKDLVDKHGWDLTKVKKLSDIEPMLADCKADGLKYPFLTQKTAMFHRWYLDDFDFFSQDSLLAVERDTDKVVDVVTTPQYKEFCDLMGKWSDEGYISEDEASKTTPDTATSSKDWGVSWWTDIPNNAEASTRYSQDVEFAKITKNYAHSTTTLGSCFCVTANTSDAVAADCVDFLGRLYTDKALADIYTFGIEGTDYNMVDGKVEKVKDAGYNHSAWESCDVECLDLETSEPDNKVQLYKDFNSNAETSQAAGFRFDKSAVEAAYTTCAGQVFDQYGFVLENGGVAQADVDSTLTEYQKALDDAGYQDVLKAAQDQYDAWKAAK
ncbi:MAG: ABC transporter substrate-binding protein [Lachnospiraceae bacterium]|jgi:putative aldouronate transport system substrate-binding protein|nr:ABC transporter substrate-binding protein [Lachnospiraceae bacterium]